PLGALERRLDANRLPIALQGLGQRRVLGSPGVEGQPQRKAHAVRTGLQASLIEQGSRTFGVVSIELFVVDRGIVGPGQPRIDAAASNLPGSQKHVLQKVVAINSRQQSLSYLGLIERRLAGVENNQVVARIAHLLKNEARILGQKVVCAQGKIILVDIVDLAGLQRKQAG